MSSSAYCYVMDRPCTHHRTLNNFIDDTALGHCGHPDNPSGLKDNCSSSLCPIVSGKSDLELLISGELLGTEDEQFKSFAKAIPEGHWSKLDISAVRFGWEAAKRLLKK